MDVKLLCHGLHYITFDAYQIKKHLESSRSHKSCLVALALKRKLCHIEYLFMEIEQKKKECIYRPKYKY